MHILLASPSATAAVSTAPWWGVPVIAGSFLLLGAVLGFFFNRANDKSRAKREADARWLELVRTLSAAILAHAERIEDLNVSNDYYLSLGMDDSVSMKARTVSAREAEQSAMQNKVTELTILTPPSFQRALADFASNVYSRAAVNEDERERTVERYAYRRGELIKEVRKYLGLRAVA